MDQYLPDEVVADERALSPIDVQLLSGMLLTLVKAGEQIAFTCSRVGPQNGSPAADLLHSAYAEYSLQALTMMMTANLAGFDQARAYVSLVRSPVVRLAPLATVARATMEAFARTFYLLSYSSGPDLVGRLIGLHKSELHYAEHVGDSPTQAGKPIDFSKQRQFYNSELKRLNAPGAARVSTENMVAAMFEGELRKDETLKPYSMTSGFAHAHGLTLRSYFDPTANAGAGVLSAPRGVVIQLATNISAAIHRTVPPFGDQFGEHPRLSEHFDGARQRSALALQDLIGESLRSSRLQR